MSANGTEVDPRVAELLRRREATRVLTPGATPRCPACAGAVDSTGVCRRCRPEEHAKARAGTRPGEPPPKLKAKPEDVRLPAPGPTPPAPPAPPPVSFPPPAPAPEPAPAPKLRRSEPATNRCPSCSGRINSFSGKCPRCDVKPPTTFDVEPVKVCEARPGPEPEPTPARMRRQILPEDVAAMKALALEGVPAEHVARRLGLDRMSVHRRIKAMRDSGELPPLVNGRAVPAAMHRSPPTSRPSSDLTPPAPAQETTRETTRETPPAPDAPPASAVKLTWQIQEPPPDPELAAIAAVSTLAPQARARVLGYLSDRFGSHGPES